jgi:ATP-dependent RNA helicase DDX60
LDSELRKYQIERNRHASEKFTAETAELQCLLHVAQEFFSLETSKDPRFGLFLFIFLAHFILLDAIPVSYRARPVETLNSDLLSFVTQSFLPRLLPIIESAVSSERMSLDIDGRVFVSLARFCLTKVVPLEEILGQDAALRLRKAWLQLGAPIPDLKKYASQFPSPALSLSCQKADIEPLRPLPFDNEVFNEEMKSVNVSVDLSATVLARNPPAHLDFGQGILFSDTQHWHNPKTILPSYLGGRDPKPIDARIRRKILKSHQRIMDSLQDQAATLTGASGGILKKIVILPVGKHSSKTVKGGNTVAVRSMSIFLSFNG